MSLGGWQQQGGSVVAPVDAATMRIMLEFYLSTGWVTFDDVTLGSSAAVRKYYYAGGQLVAMRDNGVVRFPLTDHLGSTSVTADSSGAEVGELRYKAWGETRYTSGTTPTDRRYTGQIESPGLGLYFYNARFYDPWLGRFTQPDTLIPNPGVSQSWDRYAYVNNSPVRYSDPSGHKACVDTDANGQCVEDEDWKNNKGVPDVPLRSDAAIILARYEQLRDYRTPDGNYGWWNADGNFTIAEFLGLWALFEGNGELEFAEVIAQVIIQNLYVGGYNPPYCDIRMCSNGAFNYMAATSQLQGGLFNSDITSSLFGPTLWDDTPWSPDDLPRLSQMAYYDLDSLIWDSNNSPIAWGNSESWTAALSTNLIKQHHINGTDRDKIYYYVQTFLVMTANQKYYWDSIGVATEMDK